VSIHAVTYRNWAEKAKPNGLPQGARRFDDAADALCRLEAISKIGFWFKFPSSPKGYAGQARRGRVFPAARDFPPDFIFLRVKTGGILAYFEDLKRGTNPAEKGGRPKTFLR
jgi:hypothetical protein